VAVWCAALVYSCGSYVTLRQPQVMWLTSVAQVPLACQIPHQLEGLKQSRAGCYQVSPITYRVQ
jgi:hypothetical protein